MNYSSNSSDDLSCISDRIHVQQDSSEESSLEFDTSISTAQSTPKTKRNFNNALLSGTAESGQPEGTKRKPTFATVSKSKQQKPSLPVTENGADDDGSTTGHDDDICGGQTKRLRGKASKSTAGSGSSTSGSIKRKATVHRNNSTGGSSGSGGAICDIRMIDFAHTTFVRKNVETQLTSAAGTVQHQGPDNGFLRGIESLKRLLNEILLDFESK